MHPTQIKNLKEILVQGASVPSPWETKVVINDDNLTYISWNTATREAVVVDPTADDWEVLFKITKQELEGYRFIGVIDTHTHADHISCAAKLADLLSAPLIQHHLSPSKRVHLRISKDTALSTAAGPLKLLLTPGHTPEHIAPIWGPFFYSGDTLLFGDTGRDDLPGGDPGEHWESLQKLKAVLPPQILMLPGHDGNGGRASTWQHQIEISPGLSQDKPTFIADAGAYFGPSPKILKESLYENFK